jgi:8-oxo-dGTP pyrophosphatase MutT (NUDIX family)
MAAKIRLSLELVERRLAESDRHRCGVPWPGNWSAVAAILREGDDGVEVLLIRRAEREGDPWSGQMAMPGGHAEPVDGDIEATVKRETREEVGLDLDAGCRLIGRLDDVQATARGRQTGMGIAPFVFAWVDEREPRFTLNEEVVEVLWGSLDRMVSGEIDTTTDYWLQGMRIELPAYDVKGRIVWGLTYGILGNLFDKAGVG